jgi:TPR repeat protein
LYRYAAQQGNAPAQVLLAGCFSDGNGVAKDLVEAYHWAALAATQGNAWAKSLIADLEAKMSPEQIAEGKRLSLPR